MVEKRYSKNIGTLISNESDQKKIMANSVAIIGVGGVGHQVLQQCAALGFSSISLFDDDSVTEENLQRQLLYRYSDIGEKKVFAAAREGRRLNPFVSFIPHEKRVDRQNYELLKKFDLVFDCTDSYESKIGIANYFREIKKPYIYSSAFDVYGQVFSYVPFKSICLHCITPFQSHSPKKPEQIGTLGITASMVALVQVHAAILFILNKDKSGEWEKNDLKCIHYIDLNKVSVRKVKLPAICDFCKNDRERNNE